MLSELKPKYIFKGHFNKHVLLYNFKVGKHLKQLFLFVQTEQKFWHGKQEFINVDKNVLFGHFSMHIFKFNKYGC